MARSVVRIEWGDITEAVPAFLTLSVMPATFNISHGLAAGFFEEPTHAYRGIPLVITYHPAYLLRNLPDKAKAWEDLLFARRTFAQA